jgi:NAD(P)-dependent dehydrogenase (short-subunit alcohol dehydrogenase family)
MISTVDASALLRPELLHGQSILLAGASPVSGDPELLGASVRAACVELGAHVSDCQLSRDALLAREDTEAERVAGEAVECALDAAGGVDLLVLDCASMFGCASGLGCEEGSGPGGEGGRGRADGPSAAREALRVCLDASWNVTNTVANRAFLGEEHGGRIVYIAPPADAGEHADAARAGLENLARTLSIEWARHAITAVAIAPGSVGPERSAVDNAREVAALTAYLASRAGAYFSGCLFDLRGAQLVCSRDV